MCLPADAIRPGRTYRGKGSSEAPPLRRVVAIGREHLPLNAPATEDPVGVLFVFTESARQGRMTLTSFCRWAQAQHD